MTDSTPIPDRFYVTAQSPGNMQTRSDYMSQREAIALGHTWQALGFADVRINHDFPLPEYQEWLRNTKKKETETKDPKSFSLENRPTFSDMETILADQTRCTKCYGCGQVADTKDQESWLEWLALPPGNNLAVVMGLVEPETCPVCNGTGEKTT